MSKKRQVELLYYSEAVMHFLSNQRVKDMAGPEKNVTLHSEETWRQFALNDMETESEVGVTLKMHCLLREKLLNGQQ